MILSTEYIGKNHIILTKAVSFGKNLQNNSVVSDTNLSGIITVENANNSYQLTKKLQKFSFLFYKNFISRSKIKKLLFRRKFYKNKRFLKTSKIYYNKYFFVAFYSLLVLKWKIFTKNLMFIYILKTVFRYFLNTFKLFLRSNSSFYRITSNAVKLFLRNRLRKLKYKSKILAFKNTIFFTRRLYYKFFRLFQFNLKCNLFFFSSEEIAYRCISSISILSKTSRFSSTRLVSFINNEENFISLKLLFYLFVLKNFFSTKFIAFNRKIFFSKYYSRIFFFSQLTGKKKRRLFLKLRFRRLLRFSKFYKIKKKY